MKKEITNLAKKTASDLATKPISRKEAIKKTGYMAVSAATMMLLLNDPARAGVQCSTEPPKPPTGGGGHHGGGPWGGKK